MYWAHSTTHSAPTGTSTTLTSRVTSILVLGLTLVAPELIKMCAVTTDCDLDWGDTVMLTCVHSCDLSESADSDDISEMS